MDTNAKIAVVATTPVSAAEPVEMEFKPTQASENAERAARYRLVIEEGARPGTFIYKTLDSQTGEVVRQLPREQVVSMAKDRNYGAGSLIDTTA